MIYLDSSVFLLAFLDVSEKGKRARTLLLEIEEGRKEAATSALTYDEVVWNVKKERNQKESLAAGHDMVSLQRVRFIPADSLVIMRAQELREKYGLDPRDAIHAASALVNNISTIVSTDPDFDDVKEISRKDV
ncbi:MAG: type II toxin-antitoxin system VapC family toxin [Candidatus Aenigmarchaeota archaeon]|nr:type II toxin-antitoxin system VapC family toxin [Candidatus Aenigmarchaeota archaeon]